jgi:hypothetical protein
MAATVVDVVAIVPMTLGLRLVAAVGVSARIGLATALAYSPEQPIPAVSALFPARRTAAVDRVGADLRSAATD